MNIRKTAMTLGRILDLYESAVHDKTYYLIIPNS